MICPVVDISEGALNFNLVNNLEWSRSSVDAQDPMSFSDFLMEDENSDMDDEDYSEDEGNTNMADNEGLYAALDFDAATSDLRVNTAEADDKGTLALI